MRGRVSPALPAPWPNISSNCFPLSAFIADELRYVLREPTLFFPLPTLRLQAIFEAGHGATARFEGHLGAERKGASSPRYENFARPTGFIRPRGPFHAVIKKFEARRVVAQPQGCRAAGSSAWLALMMSRRRERISSCFREAEASLAASIIIPRLSPMTAPLRSHRYRAGLYLCRDQQNAAAAAGCNSQYD